MAQNFTNTLMPFFAGGESLRDFLVRRERELTHQVAALRGQIAPMEKELSEIKLAIDALPPALSDLSGFAIQNHDRVGQLVTGGLTSLPAWGKLAEMGRLPECSNNPALRYQNMTIKELVVQSLLDQFRAGASAVEIREFIRNAYGRDIEAASLRPQIHRLKAAGILEPGINALMDTWNLTKKARAMYSMYDHPTSRKTMKELQDDPE
jgi:hypothetical protein